MDLIKSCKRELNIWYLENGSIGGNTECVLEDYKRILNVDASHRLQVNLAKCELTVLSDNHSFISDTLSSFKRLTPEIQLIDKTKLELLGPPLLRSAGNAVLKKKLNELILMTQRLQDIDARDALFLLNSCFGFPKLTYCLHSSPRWDQKILLEYDRVPHNALENIVNVNLFENKWKQAPLPVSFGGLVVRSAYDLALPAFLSVYASNLESKMVLPEVISSLNYEELLVAKSEWLERLGPGVDTPVLTPNQTAWDVPNCKKILDELLSQTVIQEDKARLFAVSCEHASDWLNAMPISSLGLKLDNSQVKIACSLRLGSQMCHPHTCTCGTDVNQLGTHGLSYKKSSGRFPRHAQVNHLIIMFFLFSLLSIDNVYVYLVIYLMRLPVDNMAIYTYTLFF